jgi:hypothetical protein
MNYGELKGKLNKRSSSIAPRTAGAEAIRQGRAGMYLECNYADTKECITFQRQYCVSMQSAVYLLRLLLRGELLGFKCGVAEAVTIT